MSEPVKVNVVSYGGVKPGLVVVGNSRNGGRNTLFDAATVTNGALYFQNQVNLTSWDVDLPVLEDANQMFADCSNLTSFNADLPKLTGANAMFSPCASLTSFSANLPELENGSFMFQGCARLTSFNADLPKLNTGRDMFNSCALNEDSVLRVLNSISTYTEGTHSLNIGKRTNFKDSATIAALLGTTTPIAASTAYSYKGWTITVKS